MAEQRRGNQQQRHHHHLAVDDVMKVLSRASRDLLLVQRQLDQEFQRSYPDDVRDHIGFYLVLLFVIDLALISLACRSIPARLLLASRRSRRTWSRSKNSAASCSLRNRFFFVFLPHATIRGGQRNILVENESYHLGAYGVTLFFGLFGLV